MLPLCLIRLGHCRGADMSAVSSPIGKTIDI
jgi:hypothetical protein